MKSHIIDKASSIFDSFPLSLLFCYFSMSTFCFTQVNISKAFSDKLEEAALLYFPPLENSYKTIRIFDNKIQNYEFAIRSKSTDMEIRYHVNPFIVASPTNDIPSILSFQKASHIASNAEDSNIAMHSIQTKELKEFYNADWGSIFIFKPKSSFSEKEYCKMLVLFKEGKGIIYIFYLFDKPSLELENQAFCFKFVR